MLGIEKTVEYESDGDTNCNWYIWYCHQKIGTRTGGFGNKKTRENHPNYSIIKIGQNFEKSPGDLRRLEETCSHSNFREKPLANAGMKNSQKRKNMIIIKTILF